MIRGLLSDYQEAKETLSRSREQFQVREAEFKVKENELVIANLKLKLAEERLKIIEKQSLPNAIVTLVVALLFGFGVNIASSLSSFNWTGWVMIVTAIALELSDFLRKSRRSWDIGE
jgi:hypothetical protein